MGQTDKNIGSETETLNFFRETKIVNEFLTIFREIKYNDILHFFI